MLPSLSSPSIFRRSQSISSREENSLIYNAASLDDCMRQFQAGTLPRRTYYRALQTFIEQRTDSDARDVHTKALLGLSPLHPMDLIPKSYFSRASDKFFSLARAVTDQIRNHQHPWKEEKYTSILSAMRRELSNHNITPETIRERVSEPLNFFQTKVMEIIDAIFQENRALYATDRDRYQLGVIAPIRAILTHSEFAEQTVAGQEEDYALTVLRQIVQIRFAGVVIYEWRMDLVARFITEGRKELMKKHELKDSVAEHELPLLLPLEWQYKAIEWAPREMKARQIDLEIGKLKGHIGMDFNPSGRNNTPYIAYRWGEALVVRMGTPTIQPYALLRDYTTIAPEFAYFIQTLAMNQQKFLYINLQYNGWAGPEKSRTNQIKSLAERYPETLLLVMLDMDGEFYYQEGIHKKMEALSDFRRLFLEEISKPNGPYELLNTAPEELQTLFSLVEQGLFPHQTTLRVKEKQIYIDFFYALFTLYLFERQSPHYLSIVCKDGLDRAGILNALLRDLILIAQKKESELESRIFHIVNIHSPTIMVKKMAMLESRRVRYLQVIEMLYDPEMKERVRELLQHNFPCLKQSISYRSEG